MPEGVFPALSLVMRYVFVALGILIVLHSFLWQHRERRQRHERIRRLPDAGMIGEFVVLDGAGRIPDDTALPVPWEGSLGSARSCDVVLPGEDIAPVHLFFSFHRKTGLTLETAGKKCVCFADGEEQTYRMRGPARLTHGSILQVSGYVLRLRLFAGLYTSSLGNTEKQDMKAYGMKVGSQGKPRRGMNGVYEGNRGQKTERKVFPGLHLVEDEEDDEDEVRSGAGDVKKREKAGERKGRKKP